MIKSYSLKMVKIVFGIGLEKKMSNGGSATWQLTLVFRLCSIQYLINLHNGIHIQALALETPPFILSKKLDQTVQIANF